MRSLILLLPALALPLAVSAPRVAARRAADDMCTTPKLDTANWLHVSSPDISAMVPKGYGISFSDGNNRTYKSGGRVVGVSWGETEIDQPATFILIAFSLMGNTHGETGLLGGKSSSETHAQMKFCSTVIGGRPVEITTYSWDIQNELLSLKESMGRHYMAVARWSGLENRPPAYLWLSSDYKGDLMSLRSMFWTATFAGLVAGSGDVPPEAAGCWDTTPAPRGTIGDFLDTSVVAMLVHGAAPPLPKGASELFMRFDSTGAVAKLAVTKSDLPAAAQGQLASIAGSNIIEQKPGAVSLLRIRISIGDSTVGYKLLGLAKCGSP